MLRRTALIAALVGSAIVAAVAEPTHAAIAQTTNPPTYHTQYNHLALKPIELRDTITPRFSITTDSVLAVVGTRIVARSCGIGHFFLRLWIVDSATRQPLVLHADTAAIPVCRSQWAAAGGDTTKLRSAVGDTTKQPPASDASRVTHLQRR